MAVLTVPCSSAPPPLGWWTREGKRAHPAQGSEEGVGLRGAARGPQPRPEPASLSPPPATSAPQGGVGRLTLFSLEESFTWTPQARSGLGKVSDQPPCVQFRNMEPVGAKQPAVSSGDRTQGRLSRGPRRVSGAAGASFRHPVPFSEPHRQLQLAQLALETLVRVSQEK